METIDYNVKIIMSAYPIMTDKMEGIFDYLQSKHIKNTSVASYINDFSPVFCEEKEFPYQTIENLCYCYTFYRGGLSACGHFHSMKKFNETFGTNYEYEEGIIDIFDENLKPSDIMPRLTKPYKLCNVCNYYKIRGGCCMISFFVCLAILIGGYFIYGGFFSAKSRY